MKNNIKIFNSKKVFDILINNQYVVNLIYDRYIYTGTYQSVYDYIQLDDGCNDICKKDIYNEYNVDDNDDILIDQLINDYDNDNSKYKFNKVITINIIKKILSIDKSLINDKNKLNFNKWMITQRLLNNGYNKNPLYMTISKKNNENYLSSVLICGKCSQLMVGNNNRIYKGIRLKYYRCSNRIIPNKKTPIKDKDKIGCDCKNLIIDYINLVIFELLINIDIVGLIDNDFLIRLYNRYRSLFLSKDYDNISNKLKRSFILIFINHIIWDDLTKRLTIYFYDTTKIVNINIISNEDSYSISNDGYSIDKDFIKIEKYYLIE